MEQSRKVILQQFFLQQEELMEQNETQESETSPPYVRWEKVKHALKFHRFGLICNQSEVLGVPTQVIVSFPVDCLIYYHIKDFFYNLTEKFSLPFYSGEWYMQEFSTGASANIFKHPNDRASLKLFSDMQWFNDHRNQFVAIVNGEPVLENSDREELIQQLRKKFPGRGAFIFQVITPEEKDANAIHRG